MGTFLFNGIKFMVDSYSGWMCEAFEEQGLEYDVEDVPVKFIKNPFVKYFLRLYTYKSVKEEGKIVYCVAIERGDEEGALSIIFQAYEKVDFETAANLEDAYHNRTLDLSDELRDFLYC